ncbi:MAG: hypothetical protein RIT28_1448 [Pseudomonadota bacterium]
MMLSLALWSSLSFAQDAEAPAPSETAAPEAEPAAPVAPPIVSPTPSVSEVNPAVQGQVDAGLAEVGPAPALIGLAAGAIPGTLCVCLGAGGCIGAAAYFYKTDAPLPMDAAMQPGPYMEAYNKELQKRRATQAIVGGTIGVLVGLGVNVAVAVAIDYI